MVFFVISRSGFESYSKLGKPKPPLWVSAGVLSALELEALRAADVEVSEFTYTLESDDRAGIEGAVETIREHHPGQTVWVGY